MKAPQRNFLNMAEAVNTYLDENTTIWTVVPVMNSSKTELVNLLDQAKAAVQQKKESQVTIGSAKNSARRALAVKADILSDALEAYAEVNDEQSLKGQVSTTMSDYFRLPDAELAVQVNSLLDLLNTHKADLADYGVADAQITELQDALDSYESKFLGKARQYRISSRQGTENLEEAIDQLRDALELLDKKIKIFKGSQPVFYNGYVAAREIVDN